MISVLYKTNTLSCIIKQAHLKSTPQIDMWLYSDIPSQPVRFNSLMLCAQSQQRSNTYQLYSLRLKRRSYPRSTTLTAVDHANHFTTNSVKTKFGAVFTERIQHLHTIFLQGAVVVRIVWQLDLQLPVQSVPINTKVVSSNPVHGGVLNTTVCDKVRL